MSYRLPFELTPIFRERIWGRKRLPFCLAERSGFNGLIGEAWFTYEENLTPFGKSLGKLLRDHPELLGDAADPSRPGICPLLVKLIFTTERLSVQVHPDDTYAEIHHHSLGKTEAWYVIDAQSDSEVALGFRKSITIERLKESAQSGEIEHLLAWHRVKAGDVVFVPAGTVHAIGAGLTICEVQENSDITYRLYDYGRPRELHLEHGAAVANRQPYPLNSNPRPLAPGRDELTACDYFRMERLRPPGSVSMPGDLPFYALLMCVKGEGSIAGQPFEPGQGWFVPAGNEGFTIDGAGSEWILTYTAEKAATISI